MSINLNLLLIEGGPVRHTVGLGNSIVDRPALPVGPQAIHYSQLQPVVDTIHDKNHIWYFTLAKGFSPEATTGEYWYDNINRATAGCSINLLYNLEYHSDEVTLHAHGFVYDTDNKQLIKFKRSIRKSFNIAPQNRVAIKWYQNNNSNHTSIDKIKYHITSTNYNGTKKNNYKDEFISVRGSVAGA